MKKILITGGAGYIGSHTAVETLNAGHEVVICDNLSNSKYEAVRRIEKITGKKPDFVEGDLADPATVAALFDAYDIDAVMHFAGYKAVGESVEQPLMYYRNNLMSAITVLEEMKKRNVRKFIFSSSATVYGACETLPLTEDCPLSTTNPYGSTKLMIENILKDLYKSDNSWDIVLLRYFNPVGAHSSGLIGEDPRGIPNNLMPFVAQVAAGRLKEVRVFGGDYPTKDGTGVRDYIHVVDLAKGHLAAMANMTRKGLQIFNLGTGNGVSVLEIIKAFGAASGKEIPYVMAPRRAGDVAECYASAAKAEKELSWRAEMPLERMCADHWNWQKNNPNGYDTK